MKTALTFEDINLYFRKVDGTKIENLENYIKEVLNTHKAQLAGNKLKISIGSDSKFKPKTNHWVATYICTIAFTFGSFGTHLICREDYIKGDWKNRLDLFTRLWREVQLCGDLAIWLRENMNISPEVHLDINPNEKYKSNVVFNSAKGYIESLGFTVQLKPDAAIASCAADHFLQTKSVRKYAKKNRVQSLG